MSSICIGFLYQEHLSLITMSSLREINEFLHRFFEEYLKWIVPSVLFPAFGFKTIPEAFKIIVLPALSYNPHQLLFEEKLTDYHRVIGRKLR